MHGNNHFVNQEPLPVSSPTALIADDEPLLREALAAQLALVWPELRISAMARNGREAVEKFINEKPDVCFLDIHMPGLSGIDVALEIGAQAHLVFVTAFDQYALQAFDAGAVDYLVKPIVRERLSETIARLKRHLAVQSPPRDITAVIAAFASQLAKPKLRWIRASIGHTTKLIAVQEIDYFRADQKYTVVAARDSDGRAFEAIIRTPLKELLEGLDSEQFVQVHRAVIVRLAAISHLLRHDNETATLYLRARTETLPVSRNFTAQFRQM